MRVIFGRRAVRYAFATAAIVLVMGGSLAVAGIATDVPANAGQPNDIAAMPPDHLVGDPIAQPVNMPTDAKQAALVKRGMYLAVAGDCQECHSIGGKPAYSGGLAVNSPVGAVFSPNITGDKKYGIGNWTDAQFYNLMHNGIGPGSSLLVFPKYIYPSMPYDAYSKLSYDDDMAIKSYLMSLQPAAIPSRESQIPFPFNIRAALLGWRMLFFKNEPLQYDASWSPQVKNGAFLVQALGHCSDCHTPRNILLGQEAGKYLGGGGIPSQSWYAPNISSQTKDGGVGSWSPTDLAAYLGAGGNVKLGAAFGPMQQVVNDSLSRLPASDVQDIVAYLQTATKPQVSSAPHALLVGDQAFGKQVYENNCARCHGENGEGVTRNIPNLAHNQAVWDGPANNIISVLLGGFYSWHDNQTAMPAFNVLLTSNEIAAVSNYVRTSWGNPGVPDASANRVDALRGYAEQQADINTGTTTAALVYTNGKVALPQVSGHLTVDADKKNCQFGADFSTAADAPNPETIKLGTACAGNGNTLIGEATVNGTTIPVTLHVTHEQPGALNSAFVVDGPIAGTGLYIHAHINLVEANYGA